MVLSRVLGGSRALGRKLFVVPNIVCEGSQSVSIQCAKRVNGKFGHMSVNFCRNLHGLHHTHRRT